MQREGPLIVRSSALVIADCNMLLFSEKIGDTVIGNPVEPGCQIFNTAYVIEPYSKLIKDILQYILSFYPVRDPVAYVTKELSPLTGVGFCDLVRFFWAHFITLFNSIDESDGRIF